MLNNTKNNNIVRFLTANHETFFGPSKKHSLERLIDLIRFKFFKEEEFFNQLDDVINLVEGYADMSDIYLLRRIKEEYEVPASFYQEGTGIAVMKRKFRALAELHGVQFVYAQGEPSIKFDKKDASSWDKGLKHVDLHLSNKKAEIFVHSQDSVDIGSIVFSVAYHLEQLKLKEREEVTLQIFDTRRIDTSMHQHLLDILSTLGFQVAAIDKVHKLQMKDYNDQIIQRAIEMEAEARKIQLIEPSYQMKPLMNESITRMHPTGALLYQLDWAGFQGNIALSVVNGQLVIHEFFEEPDSPISLETRTLSSDAPLLKELLAMKDEIQEKMKIPNLITPPTSALGGLVKRCVRGYSFDPVVLMEQFTDAGYSVEEVEKEAAKLTAEQEYLDYHKIEAPRHQLEYNGTPQKAVVKFHDHYLALFMNNLQKNPDRDDQKRVDAALLQTKEEAIDQLNAWADQYMKFV